MSQIIVWGSLMTDPIKKLDLYWELYVMARTKGHSVWYANLVAGAFSGLT